MGLVPSFRRPPAAALAAAEAAKLRLEDLPTWAQAVEGYCWDAQKKNSGSAFDLGGGRVALLVQEADLPVLRALQEAGTHSNLLRVLDLFRSSCGVCLMTGHCLGGHLGDAIATRKQWLTSRLMQEVADSADDLFDQSVSMTWISQLLSALEFLHSNSIIHCSVRPESCLLDSARVCEANLVLGNFSMTDNVMMDRPEGLLRGSASYMAPELKRDSMLSTAQPLELKSDCWSAGCVLYILLTGRTAFNYAEFPARAKRGMYTKPSKVSPGVLELLVSLLQVDFVQRSDASSACKAARKLMRKIKSQEMEHQRSMAVDID